MATFRLLFLVLCGVLSSIYYDVDAATTTTTTTTTAPTTTSTTTTTATTTTTTTTTTTKPRLDKKIVIVNNGFFQKKKIIFQTGCVYNCYHQPHGVFPSCSGCDKFVDCNYRRIKYCPHGNVFDGHTGLCQPYSSTCKVFPVPRSRPSGYYGYGNDYHGRRNYGHGYGFKSYYG